MEGYPKHGELPSSILLSFRWKLVHLALSLLKDTPKRTLLKLIFLSSLWRLTIIRSLSRSFACIFMLPVVIPKFPLDLACFVSYLPVAPSAAVLEFTSLERIVTIFVLFDVPNSG